MMESRTYFLLLILAIVSSGLVCAQNIEEDLGKINEQYNLKSLAMDIQYEVYPNHTTLTSIQTETGKVRKEGNKLYYRIGPVETLNTDDYNLVVNHDEKLIALLPVKQAEKVEVPGFIPENVNKLLATCENVAFEVIGKTIHAYHLECSLSEYSKISLIFNNKTFLLEKLKLYYRHSLPEEETDRQAESTEPVRMEITYKNIETKPDFSDNTFNYEKFVTEDGGVYRVNEGYSEYRLISQMR